MKRELTLSWNDLSGEPEIFRSLCDAWITLQDLIPCIEGDASKRVAAHCAQRLKETINHLGKVTHPVGMRTRHLWVDVGTEGLIRCHRCKTIEHCSGVKEADPLGPDCRVEAHKETQEMIAAHPEEVWRDLAARLYPFGETLPYLPLTSQDGY